MNNEYKTQLQQKEFQRLKNEHRVILKWATGCGKSKMSIELVSYALRACAKPKILFVIAERAHKKNWIDEMNKWGSNSLTKSEIICYASLHKIKDTHYDAIIFDEAHHMFTEKRLEILSSVSANYIYLLSATLPASKVLEAEILYGKFSTSSVSLKDAISNDVLPDPKVYLIELKLDDKKYTEEIITGSGKDLPRVKWEDRMKYIYKKIPCIIECTQRQKYAYITSNMEYWKSRYEHSRNSLFKNKWVNQGSLRKRYIGNLKTVYAYNLLQKLQDKRLICFCSSIDQADMLSATHTISSKKSMNANQYIINLFNAEKIRDIYAVGMANEGMNLVNIQVGVIIQLDGKERLFIQKFGRSLRAADPVSYIFYYKDTQDEMYLKGALENIDEKFIKRITI